MFVYDCLELESTVKSIIEKNGNYIVSLEDTCFYAESGGQPSDSGTINGIEVLDVYKYDNEIYHVLPEPVEGSVICSVNANKRKEFSTLHTAQHLISALFDQVESRTSSLNIKDGLFSIDLSKNHSQMELDEVERKANLFISDSLEVNVVAYDEKLDSIDKVPGDTSKIRIVEIKGLDRNACGGTHVDNLSELLYVKIVKSKPSRGGIRIWVSAGLNSIEVIQRVFNNQRDLIRTLGVEEERSVEFLEKRLKEYKKYKKQLKYVMKNSDFDIEL